MRREAGRLALKITIVLAFALALAGCWQPSWLEDSQTSNIVKPPAAVTMGANGLSLTYATVYGAVNPSGAPTTCYFEWGEDPALAVFTQTTSFSVGSDTFYVPVSALLDDLSPSRTYYYRLVALSPEFTARGEIESFTTPSFAPEAITIGADGIGPDYATIRGVVNSGGLRVTVWFEWGQSPDLAAPFETTHMEVAPTLSPIPLSFELKDMAVGESFYFRVVAQTSGGVGKGEIVPFSCLREAPDVTTRGVIDISYYYAYVQGTVNSKSLETECWFEYGETPDLEIYSESSHFACGFGSQPVQIEQELYNLDYKTTYYYRAVAQNVVGTSKGEIDYFTTTYWSNYYQTVNTTQDSINSPEGKMSLREALKQVSNGGWIYFDESLDGATLELTLLDTSSALLKGEIYAVNETSNALEFKGFQERNYGRAALYARKNVYINASDLPNGITLKWSGGEENPARVLAIFGNLDLYNVNITGGIAKAEATGLSSQPYTLARGGGLAVWGNASLNNCRVYGNKVIGDVEPSRDRGAFGGGVYADSVTLTSQSVVSGNSAYGFGAAGGGIYSVGGSESTISQSTVSGNLVTGQHAYGGGVYTDGGGPGGTSTMIIGNSTIAENLVQDNPDVEESSIFQYYYRGGGLYMSNGYLEVNSSTIAGNEVTGVPQMMGGNPNMSGGGVAATIGNAHIVENMKFLLSMVVGNTLAGKPSDLFTGSLIEFRSRGHNIFGVMDFSRMLVPIDGWYYLNRRHYPMEGDLDAVAAQDVLDFEGAMRSDLITSVGVGAGNPALLWYAPKGAALDRMADPGYYLVDNYLNVSYDFLPLTQDSTNVFLYLLLRKIGVIYAAELGDGFADNFIAKYGDPTGVVWYGWGEDWPSYPENVPWIKFWHDLESELGGRLGQVGMGEDFWIRMSEENKLNDETFIDSWTSIEGPFYFYSLQLDMDQMGTMRFSNGYADVGAIEIE